MTLSAVLIARDEEAMLPGCLDSLRGIADEIVVLDTGSTDRTMEIARAHAAIVGQAFWNDDFAAARNAALALATGDWILWIDADERLEPGFRLPEASNVWGWEIGITNDLGTESFLHRAVRLFRADPRVRWEGRVHEGVGESLARHSLTIGALNGPGLLHLGYRPEIMDARDKLARDLRLLESQIAEDPSDPFALFNLANARHCAGDSTGTIAAARLCREHLDESAPYAPNLAAIAKAAYLMQDDPGGALDWPTIHTNHALVAYEDARAWALVGDWPHAAERATASMGAPAPTIGDPAVRGYKARLLRARVRSEANDHDAALADARELDPTKADAREAILAVHARAAEARPSDAPGFLDEAETRTGESLAPYRLALARAFHASGHRDAAHALFLRAAESGCAEARFCLGDSHYARGEWALAVESYESALRLDPTHAEGWFTLGNALARMGADAVAERCYRQTLTLAPGHAGANANLRSLAA